MMNYLIDRCMNTIIFSINLENLILPTPEHTTQILSDYGMIISFYTFFDKPVHQLQIENLVFLGYSVIFLSALAVIRYRQNHIWFWLLICGIFVLMSFGPELKIFNEPTGIVRCLTNFSMIQYLNGTK